VVLKRAYSHLRQACLELASHRAVVERSTGRLTRVLQLVVRTCTPSFATRDFVYMLKRRELGCSSKCDVRSQSWRLMRRAQMQPVHQL
jgi:hypothetical protein